MYSPLSLKALLLTPGYLGGSWRGRRTRHNTAPASTNSRRTTPTISSACPSGPTPSVAPLGTPLSRAVAVVKNPRFLLGCRTPASTSIPP